MQFATTHFSPVSCVFLLLRSKYNNLYQRSVCSGPRCSFIPPTPTPRTFQRSHLPACYGNEPTYFNLPCEFTQFFTITYRRTPLRLSPTSSRSNYSLGSFSSLQNDKIMPAFRKNVPPSCSGWLNGSGAR
jgi:hypothetical protein